MSKVEKEVEGREDVLHFSHLYLRVVVEAVRVPVEAVRVIVETVRVITKA
jgi:hypothetical protein